VLTFSDILAARERLAPFVPTTPLRNYASLDVSRTVAGFALGTKIYAADERKNSDYDKVILPAYTLWSFYASKALDAAWTLRARIDNAFDRQYELASGYNTPGVGAFVTLQYQPK
jgi:vitamin B12 transporter